MKHHCPNCLPLAVLIWQPSKRRLYCPKCHRNFTRLQVAFKKGNKP